MYFTYHAAAESKGEKVGHFTIFDKLIVQRLQFENVNNKPVSKSCAARTRGLFGGLHVLNWKMDWRKTLRPHRSWPRFARRSDVNRAPALQATRPVDMADCMYEGRYCLKYIIIDIFLLYFKTYLPSFIQSTLFTGRVARQTNRLYVLRMTVQLAY